MFIYKVIPITNLPRPNIQTPSYFSGDEFDIGQMVEVPLGRRKVPAVIVNVENAERKKQEIKKSSFQLRSISKQLTNGPVFSREFIRTVIYLADYYYEPMGLMLKRMLPAAFAKPNTPLLRMLEDLPSPPKKRDKKIDKTLLVAKDRGKYYKEATSAKKNIFLVPEYLYMPMIEDILPENETVVLRNKTTKTQLRDIWGKAYSGDLKNILGTRSALFIPMRDLDQIIMESENSNSYVSWDQHPKFDARYAAEVISENMGVDLIQADTIPSIKTYHKAKIEKWDIVEKSNPKKPKTEVVDMREELNNGNFSMISDSLRERIKLLKPEEKMFLFISRRGLASAIVCRDCGYIPKCPNCDAALVLHNYSSPAGDHALICHHCGTKKIPPKKCPSCNSLRIKFIGGGTQLAFEQVKKIAPNQRIALLDSDNIKNNDEALDVLKGFSGQEYNVLIGTQQALKENLLPDLDHSAVVMADTAINLPLYNANERVFEIIWRMKSKTKNTFIAQTYHPELSLFAHVGKNNFEEFFEEELKKRKALSLPPYSQLIRISYSDKIKKKTEEQAYIMKKKIETQIRNLEENENIKINEFNILGPAPAFHEKLRGKYTWYLIIKWPTKKNGVARNINLRNKLLRVVSSDWEIVVDPIDVL